MKLKVPSNFRNDQNQWLSKCLFTEYNHDSPYEPLFTLKAHDVTINGKMFPSLHRLYVECSDSTEYRFANEVLGGWDHWNELCKKSFFKRPLEKMRLELEVKLKADAIFNILDVAMSKDSKGHLDANKFLIKEQYFNQETSASKRGRPSRQEIENNISIEVQDRKRMLQDLERITKAN